MAYQLDYKKVYNTFGPKNRRERYGTEIGKQVNNLMASFNTQLPARYGLFLNKDHNRVQGTLNGIRLIGPEKENTGYYVRQNVALGDNFSTGKIIYTIAEENIQCELQPIEGNYLNNGLNRELYERPSQEPLKSFIHIPVKPGKTYCLQFINNNNITTSETSYNYPDLYLFAEGIRNDGTKCIFANFAIQHAVWNGWHKHIETNQINFHCFLKIPDEQILSVLTEPNEDAPANDYIKITGYILGVLYPYSYKEIDSRTGEIVPYDYEMQGFLGESDRPALVDQNGTIIQYVDELGDTGEELSKIYKLTVVSTEEVADRLSHPYYRKNALTRQGIDARPILTDTGSSSFSVQVPPRVPGSVTSPLRDESFRNGLGVNKKDLIVVPVKLHTEFHPMPRRMLNEKSKKTYSTAKVRRGMIGKPGGTKWPAYVGRGENDDGVFPDIQFSDLNNFVDFLGIDGYNENNEPYSIIGFCFSVRNKHHDQQLIIPGGLYAEYVPSSIRKNMGTPYITPITGINGNDTISVSRTEPLVGNQYIQARQTEPRPVHPITIGYKASPVDSVNPVIPVNFTPPVPNGWQLISVNFDVDNITGSFADPALDLTMLEDFPTYSEDGKTIYIMMATNTYPDKGTAETKNGEIEIPYTAIYRKPM